MEEIHIRKLLNEYNNYISEELSNKLILEINSVVNKYADSIIAYSKSIEEENSRLRLLLDEVSSSVIGYFLIRRVLKQLNKNKDKNKDNDNKKSANKEVIQNFISEFKYE